MSSHEETPLRLFILGPTCSGKSTVGALVANRIGGAVLSLDSMQVYSGLPILTAQPTVEQRALAPHYLIDFIDPSTEFDVVAYTRAALEVLHTLDAEGKPAVFVGGTWYYYRALAYGMDELPAGSAEVRKRILEETGRDPAVLHAELTRVDPTTAERIHPNQVRRVVRALEIFRLSGTPMSSLIGRTTTPPVERFLAFRLTMERERLYERINARVDRMVEQGALDEVTRLDERLGGALGTVRQALGVSQLLEGINGVLPLETAVARLKRDTRRFARRQMGYLRQDERVVPLALEDFASSDEVAEHLVRRYLDEA